MARTGLRLVRLFFAGQTVTVGKSSFEMERVSIVVETGLVDQLEKDSWIKIPAAVKPNMTTLTQNSLRSLLLVGM